MMNAEPQAGLSVTTAHRAVLMATKPRFASKGSGEDRQVPPPRHRSDRNRRRDLAYAAALTLACVGTDEMVFRICEAIWYGSPCEFGRRSSR